MTKKYVSYLRVSTTKQNYGLDSQLDIVNKWVAGRGEVISYFQEQVSGKIDNRPMLQKAIDECKKEGATLLITKLDRLSRNVAFLFQLKDSGIDIACCDLPDLNTLTLGIFATMAQHERELISKRTKEGLAVAKAKGKKIGRKKGYIRNKDITGKIKEALKAKVLMINKKAIKAARHFQEKGFNNSKIAKELNSLGFTASKGGLFQSIQVKRLLVYRV